MKFELAKLLTPDDIRKRIKPLIIIEDHMTSIDEYRKLYSMVYSILDESFEEESCRKYPVSFKFRKKDTQTYNMELRHFLVHLFLWLPLIDIFDVLDMDDSFILDCYTKINSKDLNNFINDVIIDNLIECNLSVAIIGTRMSESLHLLRKIGLQFSILMGLSVDIQDFQDIYQNNDRMQELMTVTFPSNMQPHEIEKELGKIQDEAVEIFKNAKGNPIGVMLNAGSGIKTKQLTEFCMNIALKPNISGKTIPTPINSNYLIGGLNTPSSIYIDSSAAVKSMVMNKKVMGKAGHFGKIVLLLAHTLSLSKTTTDCGTHHTLPIFIKDDKFLKKYNNRFYKMDKDSDLMLLKYKRDKHLIGRTIYLRSPITCALENHVCQKCFGFNANINYDIADGVAGFGSEEITKVINQSILSAKHLLTTISEVIKFNDAFYKFFDIIEGEIIPKDVDEVLEDIEDYAIYIPLSEVKRTDDMDDDSSFNTFIDTAFYIINNKTGEHIEIDCSGKELYLSEELIESVNKNKQIKFIDLENGESLFNIEIDNNELTKPLYDIMSLLNKDLSKTEPWTLESISQKLTELLIMSGIDASALQGELILNRLIRDPDDLFNRPDFTGKILPRYEVKTVSFCLENNTSPILGTSFQFLKRQLLNDNTFTKKFAPGYLDPLYKKEISTAGLKSYMTAIK